MLDNPADASKCGWNKNGCPVTGPGWSRGIVNKQLREDPNARIELADCNPGVVALFFENCLRVVTNKVLKCPVAATTRNKSMPVERGVCGKVASVDVVVQMQGNRTQRLHYHIIARLFVSNVALFDICACDQSLTEKMGKFIDSVSCCTLAPEARAWHEGQLELPFEMRARSGDIYIPNPAHDYDGFIKGGEKRTSMTEHVHCKTCTKTWRGKFGCRLALPRPTSQFATRPMIVKLVSKCNYPKNEAAKLKMRELSDADRTILLLPINYSEGQFVRKPVEDPVLWIDQRPEKDANVPEHHPILASMFPTTHHNKIISNNAGAEKVDEYTITYVAPALAGTGGNSQVHLWCATALDNMEAYPTSAEDKHTEPNIRAARTLGQKVANGVVGRTEYSLVLMAYSNLGHDAHESSDTHVYCHNNSTAAEYEVEHAKEQSASKFASASKGNTTSITKRLKKLMGDTGDAGTQGGGSKRFTVNTTTEDGKKTTSFLFLTQAQIFAHRPLEFFMYNPEEFVGCACVVPRTSKAVGSPRWEFKKESALQKSHVVMLRRLQQTPLPGQKVPKFPGNRPSPIDSTNEGDDRSSAMDIWEKQANAFALVMVTMNSPWTATKKCKHATNINGYQQMMLEYDNSEASIVLKGRGRQWWLNN